MSTYGQKGRAWLPALAGGGADDWRIICECQRHRPRRGWRLPAIPAAPRVPALVLGISLSVGAVAFPVPGNIPPAPHTIAAPEQITLNLVALGDSLFPMSIDPSRIEDRLVGEKLREEFFRKEIPWGAHIYREARRNNLAPELVAAVIRTESDFRPALISSRDAVGLMQVLPSTGSFMGAGDITDPVENIRVGTRYLRYLNRMFNGNQTLVLAAYNAGPGTVQRYGDVPPYRETQSYVRKVQRARADYAARIARRVAVARNASRIGLEAAAEPASFASMLGSSTSTAGR